MSISKAELIETALQEQFAPTFMEVEDESHMHSSGAGAQSHFKVVLVSPSFEDKALIARHRAVNAVIDMNKHNIHALALHTYSPSEWGSSVDTESPDCAGGGD